MQDSYDVEMLKDGYQTISDLNLWTWLINYTPDEGAGFMFSNHENITTIINAMKIGHSGSSFGWTMRHMEMIAKKGWTDYVNWRLKR